MAGGSVAKTVNGQGSTTRDIVAKLWRLAGGDAAALDYLRLSGSDPVLPSSFRIGTRLRRASPPSALPRRNCIIAPAHRARPSVSTCGMRWRSFAASNI